MNKPKIKVGKQPIDCIFELIGLTALLVIAALVFSKYGELPDRIPSHYDATGTPDGYSGKSSLLFLLGITVVLGTVMYTLTRHPHLFNYSVEITESNAMLHYKRQARLVRSTNMMMILMFGYIIYATLQTAVGERNGLGSYFLPIFLLCVFAPLIWFLIDAYVINKTKTA